MKGPRAGIRFEPLGGDPPRVVVYGVTLAELFEHAAEAMYAQSYDLATVAPTYSRPIVAPGDTPVELLTNWLDELRYIGQRETLVWSWFVVDRLEEGGVQGSASGRPLRELPVVHRSVADVAVVSEGVIEVPEGLWGELEWTLGEPLRSVT